MIIIGLTGSIGMGKSTASKMFLELGVPVYDADAAVHRLYEGEAVEPVGARFSGVVADGRIDRKRLSAKVVGNAEAMRDLERIVHPLVHRMERRFLADAVEKIRPVVVLDIPLLLEAKRPQAVDAVVVVSAPAEIQAERVLARPDMTKEKFDAIRARQMPDAEKRKRAHFIIESGYGFDHAGRQVAGIVRATAGMVGTSLPQRLGGGDRNRGTR